MKFFGKAGMFLAVVLKVSIVLTVLFALGADSTASAQSRGKVLVVMSGGHLLNLKEGKVYATGYYLNELYVPLAALVKAGYTPVYANPNGDTPSMDASSNVPKFFGGDDAKRMQALRFINEQAALRHPLKLVTIVGIIVLLSVNHFSARCSWAICFLKIQQ